MFKKIFDCIGLSSCILEKLNCDKRIVVFGAGAHGSRLVELFSECNWVAFCDSNHQLWGTEKNGLPIISVDEMKRSYSDALVVISPRYCWDMIKKQFEMEQVNNEYFCLGELIDSVLGVQYFDCPELKREEKEIFVDAGVLDGLSTLDFKDWAGEHYDYAYLFEPNKDVQKTILSNLGSLNYKLINKGIWDKETSLYFETGVGANIGGFAVTEEENSGEKIPVTTLDNELLDIPVTFIKMDIEGSEYNALIGGEKLIKKYHPKLAISVYHKPEDILDIPNLIREFNPSYRFYLRHYSFSYSETILYALPR